MPRYDVEDEDEDEDEGASADEDEDEDGDGGEEHATDREVLQIKLHWANGLLMSQSSSLLMGGTVY
jgi:hypothetical protein